MHTDVAGPFHVPSAADNFRYLLAFVDAKTGSSKTYGMRTLSETAERTKHFLHWVKTQTTPQPDLTATGKLLDPVHKLKLQTDCASYFRSNAYRNVLRDAPGCTITLQQSPPYEQSKNGMVERHFQTLVTTGNAMRYAANLPPEYWYWSFRHASFLYDLRARGARKSPYEERTGKTPGTYTHLKPFGTPAYIKIHTHVTKLLPRGRECVYVGYSPENCSHLVYVPPTATTAVHYSRLITLSLDDKRLPRDALTGGRSQSSPTPPRKRPTPSRLTSSPPRNRCNITCTKQPVISQHKRTHLLTHP